MHPLLSDLCKLGSGWVGVFFWGGGGSTRRIPVFTSRLYFSWRNINQTCSSLLLSLQLSSQLGEGGNVWRGPLTIAPFIQTLYAKWLPKQFLWILHCMDLLCSRVVADLRCLYSRDKSKGSFSLIVMNWRASVSVSVRMCVQFFLLFFFFVLFFCTWKEESCYCV